MSPLFRLLLLLGSLSLPLLGQAQASRAVPTPYTLMPVGQLSGSQATLTATVAGLAPILTQRLRSVYRDQQATTLDSLQLQDAGARGYYLIAYLRRDGLPHQARFSLLLRDGQLHLPETGHIEACAGQLHPEGPGCDCAGGGDCGYQLYFDVP